MDLAIEGAIVTGMFAHPAGIKVPEDLEALLEKSSASILVNACEIDHTVGSSITNALSSVY